MLIAVIRRKQKTILEYVANRRRPRVADPLLELVTTVVTARLGSKSIIPQGHAARAVAANFFASLADVVSLPKRKRAAILLR